MKHFLTLSLCFLALSLSAQTDGWEYPFPYNPDGDADGYVTLSDLLDLLALYGNEYPDSFHYDDSGAILYLGQLSLHDCYNQARAAEGNWRLPNARDIMHWGDYLLDEFDLYHLELFPNGGAPYLSAYYFWVYDSSYLSPFIGSHYRKYSTSTVGELRVEGSNSVLVKTTTMLNGDHCYIVTEVRPEIEYHVAMGNLEMVKEKVNDSLSNGWNLIGGFSRSTSSYCSQAIWRWAE